MTPLSLCIVHTVAGRKTIRTMRGRTEAKLVVTNDGYAYVTKYRQNPFGPRIVVAEYIGTQMLHCLGLPTPALAFVSCGSHAGDIPTGVHIGSQYPGDPSSTVIYDFMPRPLIARVPNWEHLSFGMAVVDVWLANAERRQSIYRRCAGRLEVYFIDNSHLFGGPEWTFIETPETGVLIDPVARIPHAAEDVWIKHIQACSPILDKIRESIPDEWVIAVGRHHIDTAFTELRYRALHLAEIMKVRTTTC